MKRIIIMQFMLLLLISFSFGQAPEAFKFQLVIRKDNSVLTNQKVRIKTSILQTSTFGQPVFSQVDTITTNSFGIVNLVIGGSGVDSGSLQTIDWSAGTYFLKTELDETGGTNFSLMGSSQILSVPFALYSARTNTHAKFEVTGTDQIPSDTALFEVKDKLGRTVFAVYEDGVEVYISEGVKGARSGFSVGGRSTSKAYVIDEIMRVTPDSIRFYIADSSQSKGSVRAFSVEGSPSSTGSPSNVLWLTSDSTRIYTRDTLAGFGIGRIDKGNTVSNYLKINGYNTAIGDLAGISLKHGSWNTMLGYQAGMSTINGNQNVFLGYNSGMSNVGGSANIFIGSNTGVNSINGFHNTYLGDSSGYFNQTGDYNVFIGYRSGKNSLGTGNVFLGNRTGYNLVAGNGNTFIGFLAGDGANPVSDSGNVFIGRSAGYNMAGSNQLVISNGKTDSTTSLIYGEFLNNKLRINNQLGVNMRPTTNALEVNGTAYKTSSGGWLVPSDARIKSNIEEIENAQDMILKLHPVKFRYSPEWISKNPGLEDQVYYNYIAQEFSRVFPQSVKSSGQYLKGDSKEILQMDSYNAQIVAVKAMQELILENRAMEKKIEDLSKEIDKLKKVR